MQPLRIDFKLKDRMAAPQVPIHFDGLLAYAKVKMNFDPEEAVNPEFYQDLIADLPIEKYTDSDDWFYKASVIMAVGNTRHSSEFFTQRMEQMNLAKACGQGTATYGKKPVNKLAPHSGKIDVVRGVHRNMLGFYGVSQSDSYSAFCIGEADGILEMLESGYITHLGPRRRAGYGEILSISVSEDANATEKCLLRNRHIKSNDSDATVLRPIRPPYWDETQSRASYFPQSIV